MGTIQQGRSKGLVERSLNVMRERLTELQKQYNDVAEELGTADAPSAEIQRTILLEELRLNRAARERRVDQIAEELLRFHVSRKTAGETADATTSNSAASVHARRQAVSEVFGQQIKQLDSRAEEIKEELKRLSMISSDLKVRRDEMDALRNLSLEIERRFLIAKIKNDMGEKISRVKILSMATIEGAED